jgi:hypothetical protein
MSTAARETEGSREGLFPLTVSPSVGVVPIVRVVVSVLESMEDRRVFYHEGSHAVLRDADGLCYVHGSMVKDCAHNSRRLVLDVTHDARRWEKRYGELSLEGARARETGEAGETPLCVTGAVDAVTSEVTLSGMLSAARSFLLELTSDFESDPPEEEAYGYGPLGDMTAEEFAGSGYDPECN